MVKHPVLLLILVTFLTIAGCIERGPGGNITKDLLIEPTFTLTHTITPVISPTYTPTATVTITPTVTPTV